MADINGPLIIVLTTFWSEHGAALHVHAWVVHGAEDCVEASGKLDKDLKGVPPEASPHLLHKWTLVAWTGSSYCWNSWGMGCGEEKGNSITLVVELKLMMLYLYSSQRNVIYRLIYLLCQQRIESYLTSWRPQRDGHKNWPHWDCSGSWQRPPGSWGMYGSQSVGRRWHQTAERWTELSFCSASAWSEVWRTSSLQGGRGGGEGKGQQEHEGQGLITWRGFLFIFQ